MISRDRNAIIFDGKRESVLGIKFQILRYPASVNHSLEKWRDHFYLKHEELVGWTPPLGDSMKLNVDGSLKQGPSLAACGGLIRDASGAFVHGFNCNLGVALFVKA
ncbi:hypothetical protein RIF29_36690 [Crotalaria pallida]|uniref:RNase H type-1 domain-containing protein n=1 Tax=Crotalaria pallida TaxID=3830 RepID=A0AAN9EBR6_CROPI